MPKSTSRAIEVLETLASASRPLTHTEIARRTEIPKSSLSAVLHDLVVLGYVEQGAETKRYELGSSVLGLARAYMESCDIVRLGRPVLTRIVSRIDEATALALIDGDQAVVVAQEVSSRPGGRRTVALGERAPLSTTSSGKIMLAFLPPEHRGRLMESIPMAQTARNSITDRALLAKEIEFVKETGVAFSREEAIDGVVGVGVPVWQADGLLVAALSVAVPAYRFDAELEKRIVVALKEGANTLTASMGGEIRQTT